MSWTFRRPAATAVLTTVVFAILTAPMPAQPRLVVENGPTHYQVGDRIDPSTYVLNRKLEAVPLLELFRSEVQVVVLVINGGGLREVPEPPFRGFLWCQDSFDDMAVQRALVRSFEGESVQFLPVFVPPVYNPARYGFAENAFLDHPVDSEQFRRETQAFIEATLEHQESGFLPFEAELHFDPKFRLAYNFRERQPGDGYGQVYSWQGKLKWTTDLRRYGTPTLWLLGPDGTILRPPLFGNDYNASPPVVAYGFAEARRAILDLLESGI